MTPDPIKVSFLNVAIPATSKIPVLTFAVEAEPIFVSCEPSPTKDVAVMTPTLIPRTEVFPSPKVSSKFCDPAPPEPPTNLPLDASYLRNLPSTFALSSSTSSSFNRLTSPDPGPCARTLYRISLTCLISVLSLSRFVSSEFSISSLIFVSSINLIACATVSLISGVLIGSGLMISTASTSVNLTSLPSFQS